MSLKSYIKTTDDEKTIQKKLDKFKENITEQDKRFYLEQAVKSSLNDLERDLTPFLYLTHTTDEQKELQIVLMEKVVIYQKILEDFEERCS